MRTFADHLLSLSQLVYDRARCLMEQRTADPADLALRMHRIGTNLQVAAGRLDGLEVPKTECHVIGSELSRLMDTIVERRLYSASDIVQARVRYDRLRHRDETIFTYIASNPLLLVDIGVNHGDPAGRCREFDRLLVLPVDRRRERMLALQPQLRTEFAKLEQAGRYFVEVGHFVHAGVRVASA